MSMATRQQAEARKLRPRERLYIALDRFDFSWGSRDMQTVETMWRENRHIADIADAVSRHEIEVAVLILDLADRGIVDGRSGGVFGEGWGK